MNDPESRMSSADSGFSGPQTRGRRTTADPQGYEVRCSCYSLGLSFTSLA